MPSFCFILDTEDASETDMAKLEEEFTEMKEQWVIHPFCLWAEYAKRRAKHYSVTQFVIIL